MKLFYFDCETTGLDPRLNDILTLSGIIEIDGEIKETIDLKIQPLNWNSISDEALRINGITKEEMKNFDIPIVAKQKLEAFFSRYVDKFKKNKTSEDKLICVGYNVGFDIQFLEEFWRKNNDRFIGSFLDYHKIDISSIVLFLKYKGALQFPGYKLKDVAEHLGVSLKAHDASSDILATREVGNKLFQMIEVKK